MTKIQAGYKVQTLSQFIGQPAPPASPPIDFPPITRDLAKADPFAFVNFMLSLCPPQAVEATLRAEFATIGEGVILAEGGISAGFALYVQNGKLVYHYNWFERERTNLVSNIPVPTGKSTIAMEFAYDGGGLGKGGEAVIGINGKEVGRARIAHTVPGRFGIDTFGLGSDTGSPVSNTYQPPFPFTGTVERVDIELGPPNLSPKDESKLHAMHTAFVGTHD